MNPRTAPSSLTGSLSKRTALLALSGLGVVLAGIVFFDIYQDWIPEGNPFRTTLLENARPLALALSIPVVAWRISRSEFGEEHLSSATRWSVLGGITMLVVASLGLGSQIVQGEIKPLIFVTQMIAAGALAGFFVSNAIKYTDEGGHVQIRAYTEETAAVLEVEDTGIGMNPDTVEESSMPFGRNRRVPTANTRGSDWGCRSSKSSLSGWTGRSTWRPKKVRAAVLRCVFRGPIRSVAGPPPRPSGTLIA